MGEEEGERGFLRSVFNDFLECTYGVGGGGGGAKFCAVRVGVDVGFNSSGTGPQESLAEKSS